MQTTRPIPPLAEPPIEPVRPATAGENILTLLCGIWLVLGLFIDGYAHSEILDTETEDFFTPWHGIFYSGFMVTVAVVGLIAQRRARPGPVRAWLPRGYGLAAVGIAIFAVGGIGDGIWHTLLGVEVGVDALLSPTHLFLFAGLLMILSSPFRSAWLSTDTARPSFGSFLVPLASLVFTSTLVAFMLSYAWAPSMGNSISLPYDPDDFFSELMAERLVMGVILTTLVSYVPLLLAGLRWRLPFGSATLFLTFLNVAIALGFDEDLEGIPAAFVAGLVFDLLVLSGAGRRLVTAIPPLVHWGLLFASFAGTPDGLGLAPEIWGGAIVLASLALLTVELLVSVAEGGSISTAVGSAARSDGTVSHDDTPRGSIDRGNRTDLGAESRAER